MHVDEYGVPGNPTLMLLHGAGTTDTFAGQYEALSRRYHLLVPHLYGSGREVAQRYEKRRTLDALAAIIEKLDKPRIGLIGCSLGAGLALALACEHPQRVSLAAFFSAWVCPKEDTVRRYGKWIPKFAWMMRWRWMIRLQAKYWGFNDAQADFMAGYAPRILPENLAAWFCDGVRLEEYPQYQQLQIPMLAVCGSREVEEMLGSLRELGRQNPNCTVQIWKGAGHDIPMRNAKRVNRTLLDFLQQAADAPNGL